jgi:hypothetical protein
MGRFMRNFRTLMAALILLCLTPPFVLLMAGLIARWCGCEIDPDTSVSCPILGGNYGDILYSMANFGWLAVAALPVLAALVISWLLVEIVLATGRPAKPATRSRICVRALHRRRSMDETGTGKDGALSEFRYRS